MTDQKIRLGIIGFGAQGSTYAKFIQAGRVLGVEITGVADIDPARLELAGEILPDVPTFDDYRTMLASGAVDAVVTCVPHFLHPETAIAALDAGLHVLVEKPAGVYSTQVERMNEVAAANPHLRFGVMFNQRQNPLYQELRRIVTSGEIGAIRHFMWTITTWWRPQGYYDQSEWRATWGGEGGGVLVNQAPHQLDLVQWICGLPESVYAKVGYGFRRNIAVEDEVNAIFDYGGGVTGSFVTATHDLVGTDRFEILGDQGKVVVIDSKRVTVTRLNQSEQALSESFSVDRAREIFSAKFDPSAFYSEEDLEFESLWGEQHCQVIQNFAESILTGAPLIANGAEGINGVKLANAIHLSSWRGAEVNLEFDGADFLRELNQRIEQEGKFPPQLG